MRLLILTWQLTLVMLLEANQPNPPRWPKSVKIFSSDDDPKEIQRHVDAAFAQNGGSPVEPEQWIAPAAFSERRFAFLFAPGVYNVSVPVGYYTQVLGLGNSPSEVSFISEKGVYSEEASKTVKPGALTTFWRSAENFETHADRTWFEGSQGHGMLWATSQGAPLRRIVVKNDLVLYQYITGDDTAGCASGGFVANLQVDGKIFSGSQQQYFARNCEARGANTNSLSQMQLGRQDKALLQNWKGGVWNMVFVGSTGVPASHCGHDNKFQPYVTVDRTPLIAEKPYIVTESGKFVLVIPTAAINRQGVDHQGSLAERVPFEKVFVADANVDNSATINSKLKLGMHVVLSPGIYHLNAPLRLNTDNQVLLGLGLATLVAANSQAAITVGNVDGVRVAGLVLEAGAEAPEVLLDWGHGQQNERYPGSAKNPGMMHDVFARVGGSPTSLNAQAKIMVRINSGHVIGDNLWLWRAGRTVNGLTEEGMYPCDVALQVNGDDVTMYGLSAEHTLTDLVQWMGERGQVYFFQGELPYDGTAEYGKAGYTGYRVGSSVKSHNAWGVGVYHAFHNHSVVVESGIVAPESLESSFVSPLTVYLNGHGSVRHVINRRGTGTSEASAKKGAATPSWWCPSNTTSNSFLSKQKRRPEQ